MKAIRRFSVRPVLPEPLRPLNRLARNLRWSWHPETRELFESVDPEGWRETGGDPVRLLGAVPVSRLAALAEDRAFLRRLTAAADDLHDYLTAPRWYQGLTAAHQGRPAADSPSGAGLPSGGAGSSSGGAGSPSGADSPSGGAGSPSDAGSPSGGAGSSSGAGSPSGGAGSPSGGAGLPSGGAGSPPGGAGSPSGGAGSSSGGAGSPSGGAGSPSGAGLPSGGAGSPSGPPLPSGLPSTAPVPSAEDGAGPPSAGPVPSAEDRDEPPSAVHEGWTAVHEGWTAAHEGWTAAEARGGPPRASLAPSGEDRAGPPPGSGWSPGSGPLPAGPRSGRPAPSVPPPGGPAPSPLPAAIAYFSPEFGITAALPQYSGGLGILAGDHLKAASDLGVPLMGVGLLYRHGYFRQSLSREGWQQEHYPLLDPDELPLTRLCEADGRPVRIPLTLPGGRPLSARVWLAQVGRVPLLLLDSDVEENGHGERDVTDRLYGGGSEHRLRQEMLLGIGGVRAVRAYCRLTGHPEPEVFHTNEGHAGFQGLERIRELMAGGADFDAAHEAVRAGTVFTTHTPVPAGIDRFDRELVARHFGADAELPGIEVERVLALGMETYPGGEPDLFNMAVMGLRLAQRANGVSTLHGRVSREMFAGLWPGFDPEEVPITSVTNGVHAPTWTAPEVTRLGARRFGPLSDGELWELRRTLRKRLVTEVRQRLYDSWRQRGAGTAELGWIDGVLDPDVLTIGFARRVPSYKRLTLMLRDRDRLMELLLHPERPIQIVVAGKAHPADDGGKRLVQELVRFADDPRVRHRLVFLPDYGMGMAQMLYPGCDVWLNNPLRPLEACGTSGMKAALNGCLNLSVLDGWWDEWYDPDFGWAIPTADGDAIDDTRRDDLEAAALYDLLAQRVAPRFYDHGPDGLPGRWIDMVRRTLTTLGPKVLAGRMVREYVERLYAPAARSHRALTPTAAAGLATWKARLRAAWPDVAVDHVEAQLTPPAPGGAAELGSTLALRVRVRLGGLDPADVAVQAVAGRVDDADRITDPTPVPLKPTTGPDPEGRHLYEGPLALDRTGPFGYTVRILPAHRLLSHHAEPGLIAVPSEATSEAAGVLMR